MSANIGYWENKNILLPASGSSLTASVISRFPLGDFVSSATSNFTQPISNSHKLGNSGADMGKLISKIRTVKIDMYDSYGDGWNGCALRINVNGTDLPTNATISSGSSASYSFNVSDDDVIRFYWVSGSYQNEVAFVAYYTDTPPSPAFAPGAWSGSNALIYRLYGSMNSIANGTLLVSFGGGMREVIVDMFDSYGDGWDGPGALRIVINGIQVATNIKVYNTASQNTSGDRYSNTYTFQAARGDVVQFYWILGSNQSENSFIAYYQDAPPSPAFTTSNNNNWNGSNALIYRLRGTTGSPLLYGVLDGALLGTFTVP